MTDKPRFNHVAMTVAPDLLDDTGRAAILDFYGDVFGWQELPTMTEDRKRLVLMAYEFGQFVFLEAGEPTLRASVTGDHFGMAVSTVEELDGMRQRALAWHERDDRVTVTERQVEDFGVLDLTSFYAHFLLPLTVEVQHFHWKQAV